MVDMTDLSAVHGSEASAARLRKRRAAEFRLKAYGIGAIALAGLALFALLGSVVGKATLAMTETSISIPVALPAEEIADNPARANYDGLVKDALKERFPSLSGRRDRRELYGVVSGGAQFELREAVLADPSLVGTAETRSLLASDDADLYVKGEFGDLLTLKSEGVLTPTGTEGAVELHSTANDFSRQLGAVKALLLDQAKVLREQAARQENGRAVRAAEAAAATDDAAREALLAEAQGYATQRDALIAQADALETRSARPGGEEPLDSSTPSVLIEINGGWVKAERIANNHIVGTAIIPLTSADPAPAADWTLHVMELPESGRKVSDKQIVVIEELRGDGQLSTGFNWRFFTAGDSREAELAGVWGAAVGSFWTMIVTFSLAFPIGVMSAIYLEEFAPRTRLTDFIEVNINNLAAVPSIVFGLLGLAIFVAGIEVFGVEIGGFVPRSAPLAGGIVLALMTLPTIIIAARAAIRAVPPSIRDAALGVGASKLQTSFHHVLPLSMPGILTGTIIGMAQALGETAPLIMIGMVAFIVDIPGGVTDSATALPVTVYLWSDIPERAFEARTAAAICVLLFFLVAMNALAVFLRKRFERRW
ncbi:phosphate ABC transporter permease PstA [Rhodovulum sp. DZ06]|uniref:phosphate ABC transporter permease PstA n=1 Tax=Rhodovulum sp. DZ06 TaxID=3425126 RepID=UPI003D32F20B